MELVLTQWVYDRNLMSQEHTCIMQIHINILLGNDNRIQKHVKCHCMAVIIMLSDGKI